MNYAKPLGRPRAATSNSVRLLAIGPRPDLQHTIDHLCKLGFCDHIAWSKPQPYPDNPGDYFSIMTKWSTPD
jgi:hypothetical protein